MRASVTRRVIVAAVLVGATAAWAEEKPLHSLIDDRLKPVAGLEPREASDAEFLRRASLDLMGMPPKADETRAFLADPAPDKRERLIDRLFQSPQYARRLASALDLMLMERRANTNVSADDWQAWLLKSVKENKPWNVLAREIIQADGDDPAQRPAARFVLDRASDPNVLTRDIGRIFFGRDMQCAQCHDHPIVGEYLQSDYHGLLAFIAPSYPLVKTENGAQKTVQAERTGSDLDFKSVFVGKPRRTGPRLPDGVVIDEPLLLPGDDYEVPPADNVKSRPKFSRRAKLAELATDGSNPAFNANIANRLWALMFGRGLVHPLDLHHPDNPAIDPDLLRSLGDRFAAMNFDMKAFLREIALSKAYQRSLDPPEDLLSLGERAKAEAEELKVERAARQKASDESTDAYAAATEAWEKAEEALVPAGDEFDAARNQYAEAKKNLDAAVKAKTDATAQLTARQTAAPPVEQAAAAAQVAIKALPEDKELAEAAQKFVARSELLKTEITTLVKSVEEKTAAVPPLDQAFTATKPKIDGAIAKVTPLSATWKDREKPMLAARLRADADVEALAAVERRMATARLLAKLPTLKEAIGAAQQAIKTREAELAAAEKQLNDSSAAVGSREASVGPAAQALAAATARRDAALAEYEALAAAEQSAAAEGVAARAALDKAPEDAALAASAAKLRDNADARHDEAFDAQQRYDAEAAGQKAAAEKLAAAQQALVDAVADQSRLAGIVSATKAALDKSRTEAANKESAFLKVEQDLIDQWTKDFTIASLKALTPEQLCWAVFRVTGVYDRYWQAEAVELDKTAPLTEQQKSDAVQLLARDVNLEQRTFDKLKPNVGTFVTFYGAAAGQPQGDFFSTADQALFAANGGPINSWVAPSADNVTERILKREDPQAAAEELYLAVLTRHPTEDEAADVVHYLNRRASDKAAAAQELVWALLNSAEFRFNH
jgi:hypothetical protein